MSAVTLVKVVQGVATSDLCENSSGLTGPLFCYVALVEVVTVASFLSLVPNDLVSHLIF